jgi:two-component system, LytTR family, response regulator
MSTIKAILVDDEESARDVLENLLLHFCPEIELLGKYKNVEEAVVAINKHKPDLVFLDIEMPNYAGYEIIRFFEKIEFDIIFVTAYDKYALRAFELSAVDYLLKPIEIERLQQAVQKSLQRTKDKQNLNRYAFLRTSLETKSLNNIIISDKGYYHAIQTASILAIEAQESYSTIHTTDNQYTASKNLKHFEKLLAENTTFFRAHKSWLINIEHIENYSKSLLEIKLKKEIKAKLSKYKKAEFESALLHKK